MEVKEILIDVELEGESVIAKCQKFQVHKVPQYWVILLNQKKKKHPITFYETEPGKLFWFPLFGYSEQIAKKVSAALESYLAKVIEPNLGTT